jgi:hypothetical protein
MYHLKSRQVAGFFCNSVAPDFPERVPPAFYEAERNSLPFRYMTGVRQFSATTETKAPSGDHQAFSKNR